MTQPQRFYIRSPLIRANAMNAVRAAPEGYSVEVKPPGRSTDQNALFHALCEDLARSGFKWSGKERDAATWKVLVVSAHAIATKEPGQNIIGLEGELVFLRESTARMTKARSSSLIEYAIAWCATNHIPIRDPRDDL